MSIKVCAVLGKLSDFEVPMNFDNVRQFNGSIEMFQLPEELFFDRNYVLYSWLGSAFDHAHAYDGFANARVRADNFIEMYDSLSEEPFDSTFDVVDFMTLYTIEELCTFDYARTIAADESSSVYGKSYIEALETSGFFAFLDYCKQNKYDFVILGFD
jgi:hypothetical protein